MVVILTQIEKYHKFHALSYASKQILKYEKLFLFLSRVEHRGRGCGISRAPKGQKIYSYTDHKPLETLGTLHMKTTNRLQLATMDFDFENRYKKGSKMPVDFLSRGFIKVGDISVLDVNWTHAQSKDNFSNLIKEAIGHKTTCKST
jgi:hypothetical protein